MSTEPQISCIYTGRRSLVGGKIAHYYLDDKGADHGYLKPLITGAKVGTIVELTYTDDTLTQFWSSGKNAPRAIGQLPADDPRLIEWAAEDKAAGIARSRRVEADRITKAGKDPLLHYLEPVRAELARMSGDRQTATVAWILTYLLTGRPAR